MIGKSEVADVLRAAHDEMLIRGRCTDHVVNTSGEVCLEGAMAVACGVNLRPCDGNHNEAAMDESALLYEATRVMGGRGFDFIWNDSPDTTTDDVLDAFLTVEKELREEPS